AVRWPVWTGGLCGSARSSAMCCRFIWSGVAVLALAPAANPSAPPPRMPTVAMEDATKRMKPLHLLLFICFLLCCCLVLGGETITGVAAQHLSSLAVRR